MRRLILGGVVLLTLAAVVSISLQRAPGPVRPSVPSNPPAIASAPSAPMPVVADRPAVSAEFLNATHAAPALPAQVQAMMERQPSRYTLPHALDAANALDDYEAYLPSDVAKYFPREPAPRWSHPDPAKAAAESPSR